MSIKQLPPLAYLNERLSYDQATGLLKWKHFKGAKRIGQEAGGYDNKGYKRVKINDVNYFSHRLAYYMHHGVEPSVIDHINGVRDDNRASNLRSVAHLDNMINQKKPRNNKSGVVGVRLNKKNKTWVATLGTVYLGSFTNKIDAQEARALAQLDAGYHENHGRV